MTQPTTSKRPCCSTCSVVYGEWFDAGTYCQDDACKCHQVAPVGEGEGAMDVTRFHLGRAFKSIMAQPDPEEAFVKYVAQAREEGRFLEREAINLEITSMQRVPIENHEYIDTCKLYKMLQRRARNSQ